MQRQLFVAGVLLILLGVLSFVTYEVTGIREEWKPRSSPAEPSTKRTVFPELSAPILVFITVCISVGASYLGLSLVVFKDYDVHT